jgi:hypothetical protein
MRSTGAEPDVGVGLACQIELVWVGEDPLVAVTGRVDHQHPVALFDLLPPQHGVLGCGAAEGHHRTAPTDELLDGDLDGGVVVTLEQSALFGMLLQRHGGQRDRVACRVVPRD